MLFDLTALITYNHFSGNARCHLACDKSCGLQQNNIQHKVLAQTFCRVAPSNIHQVYSKQLGNSVEEIVCQDQIK